MIAIFLALGLFLSYIAWTSTFWRRHAISGPSGIPIVGNMLQFCIGRMHYGEVYQAIYKAYPQLPYIGIYRLFNEPAILLRNLDMVKEVMIRRFHNFQDNALWVDPQRDPIIYCNPFIAKGEKWKRMRLEIVPIFTPNKVKSAFPHIQEVCRKLESFVDKNLHESFEAKALFSKYTLDVVASAAYGLDAESFTNANSDFTQLVENLFQPSAMSLIETIALLFSPRLGNLIKYQYVPLKVQRWLNTVIGGILEKRRLGTASTPPKSDFIQWLLNAKQRNNEPVHEPTIVGHCSTFLLEGFETSSSLMSFTLLEYAANTRVQSHVLQEIDDVLHRHNNVVTYEALQDMPYLEASLFETLRMHPPMLALHKQCTKSFQLPPQSQNAKPYVVKKGAVFVIPVQAIQYDPDLYPDPTIYKPERFAEPSERQRIGCSFLGFGEGPRMCPGMRFGLAQAKAGLVSLLAKYSVHLSEHSEVPLELAPTTFLTATKNGIWIKFQKR